jgi:hypothetical protein
MEASRHAGGMDRLLTPSRRAGGMDRLLVPLRRAGGSSAGSLRDKPPGYQASVGATHCGAVR